MYTQGCEAEARGCEAAARGCEAAASGGRRAKALAGRAFAGRAHGALAFACLLVLGALALPAPASAQLYIGNDLSGNTTTNYTLGASGESTIHATQPITTPAGTNPIPIGAVAVNLAGVGLADTSSIDIALYGSVANPNFGADELSPAELFDNMWVPTFPDGLSYDSVRRPDNALIQFNKPSGLRSGINIFPAPENATLQPGTTYHVFVAVRNVLVSFRKTGFNDDMAVEYCSAGRFVETTQGMLNWKLGYFLSNSPPSSNFGATAILNDLNGGAGGHRGDTLIAEIIGQLNSDPTGLAVTGTPQSGQVLTADISALADDNGLTSSSTYEYQWWRAERDGSSPEELTGQTGNTYMLTTADEGKEVWVVVSYTDDHCYENAAAADPIDINAPATGAPTISGTAQVTMDLTADHAGITDDDGKPAAPADYTYLWERVDPAGAANPVEVQDSASDTYTLVEADRGQRIQVTVSFTDDGNTEESRTSAPYPAPPAVVMPKPNQMATGFAVTGVFMAGEELTAEISGITDGNGRTRATYTYTWERATSATPQASEITDITDAADTTPETYELMNADVMNWVRATVRYTDDDEHEEVLSSDWRQVTRVANQPATGLVVTGDYRLGQTLTADTDGITDGNGRTTASFAYLWERATSATPQTSEVTDITDAADATPETYDLMDADVMHWVRVTVTFTDDVGHVETLRSDWTRVTANQPATGLRVTSLARVGDTLTAITDDIVDPNNLPASPSYTYAWERAPDDAGAADETMVTTITGATDETYIVDEADQDHWVRVRVTFMDADGNEERPVSEWRQVEPALNIPADGELVITGEPRVGETLTADTDGITDEDGLTTVSYEFQWSRVDEDGTSNPEDIEGATDDTYTLQDADAGRRVRVTIAAFQDDGGNDEGPITSENTAPVQQGTADSAQLARDRDTVEMFLNRFGAGMTAQVLESVRARTDAQSSASGMRARIGGYAFGGAGGASAEPLGAARGFGSAAPGNGTFAAHTYTGAASAGASDDTSGAAASSDTGAAAGARANPFLAALGSISGLGSPSADASGGLRAHTFAAMSGETRGAETHAAAAREAAPWAPQAIRGAGPLADAPFAGMSALSAAPDGGGFAGNTGGAGSMRSAHLRGPGGSASAGPNSGRRHSRPLSLSLPSVQSLLGASSFSFTRANASGGLSSVWARGDYTSFEADQGPQSVDGDMTTAQLGADWSSGHWLAGLLALHSEADGDYRQDAEGGKGDIEATMTGVYPYLGYRFTNRLSAWGTLGYGTGEVTLKPQRGTHTEADMDLMMAALGVRDRVLRPRKAGDLAVSLRADAVFTRSGTDAVAGRLLEAETDSYRMRFGAEGARNTALAGGAQLTRSIEFGVLVDGGKLTQGGGMELGGAVAYARAGGLAVDLRWRGSFVNGVVDTRQWGVSGGLSYDPSPASARGLSLSLESAYGGPASGGVEALFARRITDALETTGGAGGGADEHPGMRMEAELGYGVSLLGGLFTGTPWARIGLGGDAEANWRLGWRFAPMGAWAPALRTGIEYGSRGRAGDEIRFRLDTRF